MYGKRYGNNFLNLKTPQKLAKIPATQMATVYKVLNQSLNNVLSLGLTKIVGVFDLAPYAKAAEVTWKHPDKFKMTIIIRLGEFHTICTLLAIVGKQFQDAGLRDLCIESV